MDFKIIFNNSGERREVDPIELDSVYEEITDAIIGAQEAGSVALKITVERIKNELPFSEILDLRLEDDETPNGGVAYPGETVREFLLGVDPDGKIDTLEALNSALVECGIKPIS